MVYAVQAAVAFRNTARRDAAANWCATRLTAEGMFGDPVITTTDLLIGSGLIVEVRFTTGAARDQFWTDIIAQFGTGANGPVAGSWASFHDCTHDQPAPQRCQTTSMVTW